MDATPTEATPITKPQISIVMPCLNEAKTLANCIQEANTYFERSGKSGEIIIADNGSTDGSQRIATALGATVVTINIRGYGAALKGGINCASGQYIVMGDCDSSYDFNTLEHFINALDKGAELVMGNRFKGGIEPGAMPFLNRYLGNPALTLFARLLFRVPCHDVYCGLRAFTKASYIKVNPQADGMEFALEMLIKNTKLGSKITEVPTVLRVDGRGRTPHLNPWRDGFRSLRLYWQLLTIK